MAQKYVDSFGTRKVLRVGDRGYDIFRLDLLENAGFQNISRIACFSQGFVGKPVKAGRQPSRYQGRH